MSDQPQLSREQIYERIRSSSKEEYILEEMKRLGFWDLNQEIPRVSEELRLEKQRIKENLNKLAEKQRIYNNREAMLKEMRKKRMEDALKKRQETKNRRLETKRAKAQAWQESKNKDITYLGKGVSGLLQNKEAHTEKLQALGLPHFENAAQLAQAMGISLSELRFLAYQRQIASQNHYRRFKIPKKTGGYRQISAPMPRLKAAQDWIYRQVLALIQTHEAAQGFVPQRSIVSNAQAHLGCEVLVNIDLKDFFPSVHYARIKGLFLSMGYSGQIATILALLCTEAEVQEVEMDGELYYVQTSKRHLPQGSPASPVLTNLLCRRLDARMTGLAQKLGATYTRYADDLSFSMNKTSNINRLIWQVKQVIEEEGFVVHPNKLHVMRKGDQKMVTGLVVNEKLNPPKSSLKRFRAVLHRLEQEQEPKIVWGQGSLEASIKGFANFVHMVNPEKGQKLLDQVHQLLAQPDVQAKLQALNQKQEGKQQQQSLSSPLRKQHLSRIWQADNKTNKAASTSQSQEEEAWWQIW